MPLKFKGNKSLTFEIPLNIKILPLLRSSVVIGAIPVAESDTNDSTNIEEPSGTQQGVEPVLVGALGVGVEVEEGVGIAVVVDLVVDTE